MSHLLATPRGITLAGVILAKRSPNGTFNIRGREKEIHAQLQAAYGKAVTPQAMRYVERGCELLAKVSDKELEEAAYPFHPNPHAKTTSGNDFSDLTKGLMMFALTGLNDMENIPEGKARLLKMQASAHHDNLLKSYGLPTRAELAKDDGDDEDDDDEDDDSDDSDTSAGGENSHYNPDEPRIPAGQPGGGQWTTAGNGVSSDSGSISADDVRTSLDGVPSSTREYQVADSGQIMTDANVVNSSSNTTPSSISASSMSLSNNGLDFIKDYETFSPTVYPDQAGYDTIGYGHKLTDGESYPDGITQEQALQLLASDVAQAEQAVRDNVTVNLTQSQFNALVSFTYNEGPGALASSTLLRYLNAGDFDGAANEFANWNKVTINGVKVISQGLVRRRNDEKNLFSGGSA